MEIPSYEELMAAVLARVPEDVDKREGSLIYTAAGPVCAELAQGYIQLKNALDLLFFDTSLGEYLDRLAGQLGLQRKEAGTAVCRGAFFGSQGQPFQPPVGMRLGCGGVFYRVAAVLEDGAAVLECETPGTVGNQLSGALLPVDYLEGFGWAELDGLVTAGQDEETDDELRARLAERVQAPAFGGNIADYQEKVRAIEGVGAVKVTPVGKGAGTVKLTLLDDGYDLPGENLVARVQAAADPDDSAQGRGFAPIGHVVTAEGAAARTVDVAAAMTFQEGITADLLQEDLRNAVERYFLELRQGWEKAGKTVVRLSRVVMELLEVQGVLDAAEVTLNGAAANLETEELEVPVLGELLLTAQ